MDSIPRWFDGVRINLAENLLFSRSRGDAPSTRGTKGKEDSKIAVTEVREGYKEVRHVSWAQLRRETGELIGAMQAAGVKKGDRVAIVASNSVDTLKVFLAIVALGGIFSSSSTDMGTKGVLDRCLQIEPKVWSTTGLKNLCTNASTVYIHGRLGGIQWQNHRSAYQDGRDRRRDEVGICILWHGIYASIQVTRRYIESTTNTNACTLSFRGKEQTALL